MVDLRALGSVSRSARGRSGLVVAAVLMAAVLLLAGPVSAATTDLRIVKYGPGGGTILVERTVNASWMEANLPVQGDGTTHYYHQGPTFNASDPWDPAESQNVESRDMGAVKGTALRDLCGLVGGIGTGDVVKVRASDGFFKNFSAATVLAERTDSALPVVCWYNGDESETGDPQGVGYVPEYHAGMRLVFFADTSTNPWGWHVFGNEEMHATLGDKEWHFYNGEWPSSSGLSVRDVSEILIYSSAGSAESRHTTPSAGIAAPLVIVAVAWVVAFARRR